MPATLTQNRAEAASYQDDDSYPPTATPAEDLSYEEEFDDYEDEVEAYVNEQEEVLAGVTMHNLHIHLSHLNNRMKDHPDYELTDFDQWAMQQGVRVLDIRQENKARRAAQEERERAHQRSIEVLQERTNARAFAARVATERHQQRLEIIDAQVRLARIKVETLDESIALRSGERRSILQHKIDMKAASEVGGGFLPSQTQAEGASRPPKKLRGKAAKAREDHDYPDALDASA